MGGWDHRKGSQDPAAAFPRALPASALWAPRHRDWAKTTQLCLLSANRGWFLGSPAPASPAPARGGSDHSGSPVGSSSLNYTLES